MKKLFAIFLVMLMCSFAIANGSGQPGMEQDQNTDVTNIQGQGQINYGNSTDVSLEQNYGDPKIRVNAVGAYLPYHLQVAPAPNQIRNWNGPGFTPAALQAMLPETFTRQTIKNMKIGGGYKSTPTVFVRCDETDEINLKLQITLDELANGYECIGVVNIGAKKGKTYYQSLGKAVNDAMEMGGEMALMDPQFSGMNAIMHGSSIGPGASNVTSSANNASAFSLGLNLSDTKGQAESAMILAVFRTNGVKATAATGQATQETTVPRGSESVTTPTVPIEETQINQAEAQQEPIANLDEVSIACEDWLS